ncbi:PQQ-dependent sugar dehydrogenase [Haladaptatus caseinilyticus]|uniref:PQQ-dependent sugar dehydrogenase n=1 Tax=Haladaptatus caseinilyticus TaxID=2993314 RepID=UPI00224B607D|nr:PQQ-dependent sugar dehydrogenase [Haladaptatus caseinilyticus]
MNSDRRQFLQGVVSSGVGVLTSFRLIGSTSGQNAYGSQISPSPDGQTTESFPTPIGLHTVVTGMQTPLDIAFAPAANRRYIVDQVGVVYTHDADGLREEPFLDLQDAIVYGTERGVLGIALHPNFATNRRVFIRYSAPQRPGTPEDYSHTFVLAEFRASKDGTHVLRDSERTILEIPEPNHHHNGGAIKFGPDGYLYVSVGDGGGNGGGLGSKSSGQDVNNDLLGSILRLDIDRQKDGRNYAIPDDNPLVGKNGLDEHYAWGFRNPWRMSFDGPDLFVGDVGDTRYEEVDLVKKGGNYGWKIKEGNHCIGAASCPDAVTSGNGRAEPLIDPIIEYPHSTAPISGVSVIGGYVYRGSTLQKLNGVYIFGDLVPNGRLFVATPSENGRQWTPQLLEIANTDRSKLDQLFSFSMDNRGEIYALGFGSDDGGLYRLIPDN